MSTDWQIALGKFTGQIAVGLLVYWLGAPPWVAVAFAILDGQLVKIVDALKEAA